MRDGLMPPPELGAVIRTARKSLSLTLEQVAERSGVSKSMLSQIERGAVNPTFAVVWNLMQALNLELSDLTEGAAAPAVIDHTHAYSTPTRQSRDGLVTLRLLSPHRTVLPVEWYDVQLAPGGVLDSDAHAVGTYEHLTCLDGAVSVAVGETRVRGAAGDTLRYPGDRPHRIENAADGASRALLLVALPKQYAGAG